MKAGTSENYPDKREDGTTPIVDPAESSESAIENNYSKEYNVPKNDRKTWCSYMENGFRDSRLKSTEIL